MINTGVYKVRRSVSHKTQTTWFEGEILTQADLVHDSDTSLLALGVELLHSGRNIGGGDNILLGADSRLDDGGVESVGDQRDDQVDLLHGLVESGIIADIKGDGLGVLEVASEGLGTLKGTASYLSHIQPLARLLYSQLRDGHARMAHNPGRYPSPRDPWWDMAG